MHLADKTTAVEAMDRAVASADKMVEEEVEVAEETGITIP